MAGAIARSLTTDNRNLRAALIGFVGGTWGIVLIFLMDRRKELDRPWIAVVCGGAMPTLVAALGMRLLKGGNMADWMELRRITLGFAINGLGGLGIALVDRLSQGKAARLGFARRR